MEPINYAGTFANAPDPFSQVLKGYQGGMAIQQEQLAQQQMEVKRQQMLQLAEAQQQARLNPSADTYARLISLNPQAQEAYKTAWSMQNDAQQQAQLSRTASFLNAFNNGDPQAAADAMRSHASALGLDSPEGKKLNTLADLATKYPDLIAGQFQAQIASNPKGAEYLKSIGAIGEETRKQELQPGLVAKGKAEAQIKGTEAGFAPRAEQMKLKEAESKIRESAARIGLDQDKLVSETNLKIMELKQKFGQLPDDARKLVNDSAVSAVSSEQQVQQYQKLASDIEGLGGAWGSGNASSAGEWLSRAIGNEDAVSALKREYTRMASAGVTKLLPPGPASDKDIQNAKEGIPNANASPTVVASYLRGMAKLSAYDAVFNEAKSEWAGAVQHLGRAKTDVEINGVKVPAGTTFNEFARKYLASKAEALDNASRIASRSYMRVAPQAAPPAAAAVPPTAPISAGD